VPEQTGKLRTNKYRGFAEEAKVISNMLESLAYPELLGFDIIILLQINLITMTDSSEKVPGAENQQEISNAERGELIKSAIDWLSRARVGIDNLEMELKDALVAWEKGEIKDNSFTSEGRDEIDVSKERLKAIIKLASAIHFEPQEY
jgi:hypothetical protein